MNPELDIEARYKEEKARHLDAPCPRCMGFKVGSFDCMKPKTVTEGCVSVVTLGPIKAAISIAIDHYRGI